MRIRESDSLLGHQTRAIAYAQLLRRLSIHVMQSAADPCCSEPDKTARGHLQDQLMVSESLATLNQSKVSDQAVLSAAHSSESDICKTPHCAQLALRSEGVNS